MRRPLPNLFLHAHGRQKREKRKDIFENVDKRLSVSLTHLPKGVIRELSSVRLPWSCNGHFFNTGLPLSLHPAAFYLLWLFSSAYCTKSCLEMRCLLYVLRLINYIMNVSDLHYHEYKLRQTLKHYHVPSCPSYSHQSDPHLGHFFGTDPDVNLQPRPCKKQELCFLAKSWPGSFVPVARRVFAFPRSRLNFSYLC